MNRFGYYYEGRYRLDDIEDYDNTEYSPEFNSKQEAIKWANQIKKEYGERIVMLDIYKYNEEEWIDCWTII